MECSESLNMSDYKVSHRALIEEISADCCTPGKYCTLKEILIRSPRNSRTLVQLKCIEKLKYERSKERQQDIGWNEAYHIWMEEGMAERFSQAYQEGIPLADIYATVMGSKQP